MGSEMCIRDRKMNVFGEGLKITFVPSEEDLAAAKELGRQFAQSL